MRGATRELLMLLFGSGGNGHGDTGFRGSRVLRHHLPFCGDGYQRPLMHDNELRLETLGRDPGLQYRQAIGLNVRCYIDMRLQLRHLEAFPLKRQHLYLLRSRFRRIVLGQRCRVRKRSAGASSSVERGSLKTLGSRTPLRVPSQIELPTHRSQDGDRNRGLVDRSRFLR
jgi:hypothetical protein